MALKLIHKKVETLQLTYRALEAIFLSVQKDPMFVGVYELDAGVNGSLVCIKKPAEEQSNEQLRSKETTKNRQYTDSQTKLTHFF